MKRRLVESVLLAVILAVSLGGVALAVSQTWDLDSDSVMYKETHTETGSVTIGSGQSHVWTAENAAQVNVPFTAGTWTGTLVNNGTHPTQRTFTVSVGYYDGTFHSVATSGEYSFTVTTVEYSIVDSTGFTVLQNDYLAIQVTSTGNQGFEIVTTGTSDLDSPAIDPAYPVSELPTIILFATGLVFLATYLWIKRRKMAYYSHPHRHPG